MVNLVLFGPPGAGKGTQSDLLKSHFDLVHISTGDVFRALDPSTELAKLAKSYADKGDLVPDDVTIKILESEVQKHSNINGVIYDGFPRTIHQANALDEFLEKKGTSVTLMLALDVSEDELKKRLLERSKISGRKDDADESIIETRINNYNKSTAPVAEYYQKQNKLVKINGLGSIDEIFDRLKQAVEAHSNVI